MEALRQYWQVSQEMSIENDHILYRCRLLIPTKILAHFHLADQGIAWTKQRTYLTLCWPGIDNNIENIIIPCQDHLPSNHKELLQAKLRPVYPSRRQTLISTTMQEEAILVWVDCYSDWPIIAPMDKNTI